jgi:hypothetical protein
VKVRLDEFALDKSEGKATDKLYYLFKYGKSADTCLYYVDKTKLGLKRNSVVTKTAPFASASFVADISSGNNLEDKRHLVLVTPAFHLPRNGPTLRVTYTTKNDCSMCDAYATKKLPALGSQGRKRAHYYAIFQISNKEGKSATAIVEDPIQVDDASEDDHNLKPTAADSSGGKRKRTHVAFFDPSGGKRTPLAEEFNGKRSEDEAMAAVFAQSRLTSLEADLAANSIKVVAQWLWKIYLARLFWVNILLLIDYSLEILS